MAQDYAAAFYKSKAWQGARRLFLLRENHTCALCGGVGEACIVHHIQHITPQNINDLAITLNLDNLQALCLPCHNATHGDGSACADGISFDDNGGVVYTPPG